MVLMGNLVTELTSRRRSRALGTACFVISEYGVP